MGRFDKPYVPLHTRKLLTEGQSNARVNTGRMGWTDAPREDAEVDWSYLRASGWAYEEEKATALADAIEEAVKDQGLVHQEHNGLLLCGGPLFDNYISMPEKPGTLGVFVTCPRCREAAMKLFYNNKDR